MPKPRLFKVLLSVCIPTVYGYETFILIVSHSASEAEGKVRDILEGLKYNSLLKDIYGDLAPKAGQAGCSQKNFATRNHVGLWSNPRGNKSVD